MPVFSRRDFLKLSGAGLVGLALPTASVLREQFPLTSAGLFLGAAASRHYASALPSVRPGEDLLYQQGRILEDSVTVYDQPTFSAQRVKLLWRDALVAISGVTLSEDTTSHNLVWYRIGEEGYIHSGVVQPVRTELNAPELILPEGGNLAEVTVPYTDAHWGPSKRELVAYRFYYGTTHWVIQPVIGEDGEPWYMVLDDKWEFTYFAPAAHLRLVPKEELEPLSPQVPQVLKYLDVRLNDQLVVAYEGYTPVFMARIASGGKFRDGNFETPSGAYLTFHKRPSRHMAAGNLAANGYDLPGVPWISYFTESGIAFHGTYWHNNFGAPRSHGCINLTSQAAKWIYRWTHPVVPPHEQMMYENSGTSVRISQTGDL